VGIEPTADRLLRLLENKKGTPQDAFL